MESKRKSFHKICVILTIIMILSNMLTPYSVFLNISNAATPAPGEPYYEMSIRPVDASIDEDEWTDETYYYYYDYYQGDVDSIEDYSGTRVIFIDLAIKGSSLVNGGGINLKYDSSRLVPAQETYSGSGKNKVYWIEEATEFTNPNSKAEMDFATIGWGTPALSALDTTANTIRSDGAVAIGQKYIEDGEIVGTFMFKLQDGVTLEDLTTDTFSLIPGDGLQDGLQIVYWPDGVQKHVDGENYLLFSGFASGEKKQVVGISLVGNMNKSKYYIGENLDFSGLAIKVEYSDGSSEEIQDIELSIKSGLLSIDSKIATENKKSIVSFENFNCDILYNIATSIKIEDQPHKVTYNHGDTIDFTGGSVKITYDDGSEEILDMNTGIASGKLTVDRTIADSKNTFVTFTYIDQASLATLPLTVNDPIDSIVITKMPSTVEFNHGDAIDVTGGEIKAIKRSGDEITGIQFSDPRVTIATTTADINSCTTTWSNGNMQAGNQKVTVTFEGKQTSYNIVVNDTIDQIQVKSNITAKNKYGTPSNSLNYTGASIEVITSSGNTFDVPVTAGMVDISSYNANTLNVQNLPITYASKTTAANNGLNVQLVDYISGITVTAPSNLSADYNTNLDLSNVSYVKNYASGVASSSLPVTSDMISGFNKTPNFTTSHEVTQTVTVTLSTPDDAEVDNIPVTDTFDVKVKDVIEGIKVVQKPNKVTYDYAESFSKTGGKIELAYASGITSGSSISMTDSRVSVTELDGSVVNTTPNANEFVNGNAVKTLKVTYTDNGKVYETTLQITVLDLLEKIEIIKAPQTVFEHGDNFTVGEGELKVTYKSGNSETVSLDDATITETLAGTAVDMTPEVSEYSSNESVKNVTASYEFRGATQTVAYDITIKNTIDSIAIESSPKTSYNLNDPIANAGGTLKVTRKAGNSEIVNITDSMISGLDTIIGGIGKTATVTYTEGTVTKTTTYTYDVQDIVTSISIKNPPTDVKYGEELDLSNTTIDIVKGSGKSSIPVTNAMVSGFNKNTLGNQTLTVSYGGQKDTFIVNVKDYVKEITLSPATVSGNVTDSMQDLIDNNSIKYTVVYAEKGPITPATLTDSMVTGYNPNTSAKQNLTVTYTDNDSTSFTKGNNFTAKLEVSLSNIVTGITITPPTTTTYNHGDSLNLSGGTINLTYADGTTGSESLSLATIVEDDDGSPVNMSPDASEFSSNHTLSKTLQISYSKDGATGSVQYPIVIVNDIRSISVHTMPKHEYNVAESLDLDNGEILVKRATGTDSVISMLDNNVSVTGFNSNVENPNLSLTVSYKENNITKTTNYTVSVQDTVTSIKVQNPPTTVKYGEELDLSGTTIDVVKGSGTTSVPVTSDIISGFDKNTLGDQTVTISYGGKKDTFVVNVKDYIKNIIVTPNTVEGHLGNSLNNIINKNNIKYTVVYAKKGSTPPSVLTDSMVTGYNANTSDTQNLTVTYKDNDVNSFTYGNNITANLEIKLSNIVTGITITPPTTTTYNHGDTLNLSGGTINLTYADGTTGSESINSATILEDDGSSVNMEPDASEFSSNHTLSKTLQISYSKDGVTGTAQYPIVIVNDIRSISVHTMPKQNYNVKESLDLNDGEILVKRAVGTDSVISMLDSNVSVSGFNSSVENENLVLTVSYVENDITLTTGYAVKVKDNVTSITVKNAPTSVKFGEELDLSGTTIDVVKGSGNTSIPVTNTMISGFDKNTLGDQTVTITYGGQKDTFVVNVKDYIQGIALNPSSVSGKLNDSLQDIINNNNIKYTVIYASKGSTSPSDLTDSMVTGYNPTTSAKQNLTVTYTDNDSTSFTNGNNFTANLEVLLSNTVTGITITPPTTTTYNYGDTLNLSGGTINLTYADGTTGSEPITSATISEADGSSLNMTPNANEFSNNNTLNKELTITYSTDNVSGSVQYPITIVNDIRSISVHTMPKHEYNVAESLDLDNGEILVKRATGTDSVISMLDNNVSVTGFDSSIENLNLSLKVSYKENNITKDTSYVVSVKDNVTSITVKNPPTSVQFGKDLDLSNTTIDIVKGSGNSSLPVTSGMISGFDKNTLGAQTVTVTYGGQKDTFVVNVQDYVKDINLVAPTKTTYHYNEVTALDLTGGSVQLVMASGTQKSPVSLNDPSVTLSAFNPTKEGTQTITVEYEGFTKSFDVKVINATHNIVVNNPPTSVDYGKKLDLSNTTITITKDSGTETIPVTEDMLSKYDSTNLNGPQKITVTYGDMTDTFDIVVNDYLVDIVLTAPSKTTYEYGESLDISDGYLTKVTASGATNQTIALDASMISGYDSTKLGSQTITVNYEGIEKTFGVTVVDNIQGIQLTNTPKTDYNYGESLDVTNGTITVIRSSGSTTIDITPSMVTGFNPNVIGTQTLTVNYKGFETSYTVNVSDYIEKIELTYPDTLVYRINEPLDLTGGSVSVIMASGTVKETVAMDSSMISGFDSSTAGAKNLTVSYAGKQASFGITVVDGLASMQILTLPNKLDYLFGEEMDLTGGSIQITRDSGIQETIPMDASMISGFTTNKLGQVVVTVNYEGLKQDFIINVEDYEKGATFVEPSKKVYEYGEDLDLKGGSIKITMASGAVKEVTELTGSMVSGFNNKVLGNQTLTVNYKGYTHTFNVSVKDTTAGIALNKEPNKTQFNFGQNIDITGGQIKVIKSSGTKIIDITAGMISGYKPNVSGCQVITVTYEGHKTDFVVYVYPQVAPSTPDKPQTDNTKPSTTPEKPDTNKKPQTQNTTTQKPVTRPIRNVKPTTQKPTNTVEQTTNTVIEKPDTTPEVENVEPNNTVIEQTKPEEKPTITLGEKDVSSPKDNNIDLIAKLAVLGSASILLLLLILQKNTKIYVEEDGEFVLGGKERLGKKDPEIDINKYLDGDTYNKKVKVVLNEYISEKLDKKEITIKHRDKTIKVTVKYDYKPFEIILE